jgi:hypothetical protein
VACEDCNIKHAAAQRAGRARRKKSESPIAFLFAGKSKNEIRAAAKRSAIRTREALTATSSPSETNQEKEHDRKLVTLGFWLATFNQTEEFYNSAKAVLGSDTDAPLFRLLYGNFDRYTELVAASVGTDAACLHWFLFDNEAGKKGKEAGPVGPASSLRKIKTLEDLLWLIELPGTKT